MVNPTPAWEVTGVTPIAVTDKTNRLVEGFQVNVRVADGHEFNIKVAAADYNPETVRERIDSVFQNYMGIRLLKGDLLDTGP